MRGISARRGALTALVAVSLAAGCFAAPAAAGPSTAKLVRLPFPRYDGTLTPYTFEVGYPLVTLVYDTLMWRDDAGVPRPWLARSVTRTQGGRRLTVKLRPGVRWHDGRPLTAADVAFTFRYVALHFQPRFTPQLRDVATVRATDRTTVTFELRRPSLGFADQPLADLPILPAHLWRGLPAGQVAPPGLPVGSGPYHLARADKKAGYVLRANRGYFKGSPRVGEIRVPIIDDAERTYRALRERRVDMVPLSLPRRAAETLGTTIGISLQRGPSYSGTALLLNLRRAPFDRPDVRRAVAAALDLGRIVRNVAPAQPAEQGFVHPASRLAAGAPVHRFDLRAGQQALGQAGLPPIRLAAPGNDPVRLEAGRQVVLALRRAGADATLVELSRRRLGHAIGEDGSPPSFQAAIQSTPPLVSDDPDYLRTLFGSDPQTSPLNFSGYRSAAFDALARRVASAPDRSARAGAVRAELQLLARDAPSVPLFFSDGTFAYRPAIYDGWRFVKGAGILDKRSFLPGQTTTRRAPRGAGPGPGPGERVGADSGSGLGVIDVISILVLVAVLLLAGVGLVQWLRSEDRR